MSVKGYVLCKRNPHGCLLVSTNGNQLSCNDSLEIIDWTRVRLPPAPQIMNKSEILDKETKELLVGVEQLELRFKELKEEPEVVLFTAPAFFTLRAVECIPLIANCVVALAALPRKTPKGCKIRRKQFGLILFKLEGLESDNFPYLQNELNTLLDPITETADRAIALGNITITIPDTIADFVIMKEECEKVKKAMSI